MKMNITELEALVVEQGRRLALAESDIVALNAKLGFRKVTPLPASVAAEPEGARIVHPIERAPIALPTEPATPDANALPGQPAPRPLAGPIMPLVASSVGTDQLLGGPGSRPAAVDALAARTLVKGEALAPPAGRADDFAWPRREVGTEQAKGETPMASVSPDGTPVAPAGPPKPKKIRPIQSGAPSLRDFFGIGPRPPTAAAPPARSPAGPPRPPGNVGRSASVPGFFAQ